MKIKFPVLLFFVFCLGCWAHDVPVSIGSGSDTVWLKTGVHPVGKEDAIILPEYGVSVFYGPDKTVDSIVLSTAFDSSKGYTLRGIGLGDSKTDVVKRLGKPVKELPKDKNEVFNAAEAVWIFGNQLLIVAFWQADETAPDKHVKDSVAWVTLRKAHF
jgi:hypothetical protein